MSSSRYILPLLDLICIFTALSLSSWLMLPPELAIFDDYTGASTFTVIIFCLSFYMLDCYNIGKEDFKDTAIRVVLAIAIGIVGAGFTFYTFEHWRFPRLMFVFQMLINLALSLGWRGAYYLVAKRHKPFIENIILLGFTKADRASAVLSEYRPNARIVGYMGDSGPAPAEAGPCLGAPHAIFEAIARHKATGVVVVEPSCLTPELASRLFKAKLHGLPVDDMRGLYERLAARVPVDFIEDSWLLLEDGFNLNVTGSMRRIKRAFDICFCLALLPVALPIMVMAAISTRIESPGPVIYSQTRVGLYGKEFTLYKIRSMKHDSEIHGAVWASYNDPRITRVGRFIRKTRIDELPQLFNVLKGEMSIIGPRPERMSFVKELSELLPYYYVRHTVKPGITGWAQVSYPYGASLEDSRLKLEYDLYYIKNLSALLETKVLLKTIGVILFPKGAR